MEDKIKNGRVHQEEYFVWKEQWFNIHT